MLGLLRASSQGATTRGVKYWTLCPGRSYRLVAEVVAVSEAGRLAALERAGLVHPRAEAVTAPLFSSGGFFLAADKVQVKYEMLRAHLAERMNSVISGLSFTGPCRPRRSSSSPAIPACSKLAATR